MLTAYLCVLGLSGLLITITFHKYFYGRFSRSNNNQTSSSSENYYMRYYHPRSAKDKLLRNFMIYLFPVLVCLCGVSGLGINMGNFFLHVVSLKTGRVPDEITVMTPTSFINENGFLRFLFTLYFLKFFVLTPLMVAGMCFLATLACVELDQQQSGPGSMLCIGLAALFGFIMTELMMIVGVTPNNSFSYVVEPELLALWRSCSLSGLVTFVSILLGRSMASD
jgi:hypothetical protein